MSHTHHRLRLWITARRSRRIDGLAGVRPGRCDTHGAISVEHIDDPDRAFRLVRAAGVLTAGSIDRLFDAWATLMPPYAIHLDLSDVRIDDADTMRRLESALDHLERQRINIRLVGIDPYHPVLQR